MKKVIRFLAIVLIAIISTNAVHAQDLGQTIDKFFNDALNNSQKNWVNLESSYLTLQIMVMNPGNNQNGVLDQTSNFLSDPHAFPRNNAQWYVAYGEANIFMPKQSNGKVLFPQQKLSSGVSASGSVTFWFSDRSWSSDEIFSSAGCKPPPPNPNLSIPATVDTKSTPFSRTQLEKGNFSYSSSIVLQMPQATGNSVSLNLFTQWNWKVTKAFIVGNMLYGEINGGKQTFSISYGAYGTPPPSPGR